MKDTTRRDFLLRVGGAVGVVSLCTPSEVYPQANQKGGQELEVSPAEDLMREHGVLRRLLLIYQEWIRRLRLNHYEQLDTLAESNRIIRSFVENYHEKLEEEYLFPRFKKAGKLVDLVSVLLLQHHAGRKLTDVSILLSNAESLATPTNKNILSSALHGFIRMYEPHAAREDTVLFPAFHEMAPGKEYDELGDAFEEKENEMLGENGFEKMVDRVASIEKRLGIYDLARFTPRS